MKANAPTPPVTGRPFNSECSLSVWGQRADQTEPPKQIGVTPAAVPLVIPAFTDWWVEPLDDTTIEAACDEVRSQSIPGLRLRLATDADLSHLSNLKSLRSLDLESTQVTDAGLEHLGGLTGLQDLILGGTQVSGAGMEHLKNLTRLRTLVLTRARVTDEGLGHLSSLTGLQTLAINGTRVTDAGLAHLVGLKGLQLLIVDKGGITDRGCAFLKSNLPNCNIVYVPSVSGTP